MESAIVQLQSYIIQYNQSQFNECPDYFLVFLLASVVSSKKFAERWVISTCDFRVLFDVYRQNLHSSGG